jgi:CHASE3 domain sensor protein
MKPALDDIEDTVLRMEQRFRGSKITEAQSLMQAYDDLNRRFEADLSDRRDLALSRGGALMLIKVLVEDKSP